MPADLMQPTRKAVMAALKADDGVTALIAKESIYPGTVPAAPAWPFSRFGTMIASPFAASGLDSSAFRLSVQAFSKDVLDGSGATIAPAEDNVLAIGSAIKAALDDTVLPIAGVGKLRLTWIQTAPQGDPTEASAWMTTVTLTGEVSG